MLLIKLERLQENVSVLKTKKYLEELSRFSALYRFDNKNMSKMFSASRLEMAINVTETA